jgi:adenine-specific DNA-methyltransferase
MSQKYQKLKTLLKELFQLDQPDLDFGLYRIMHAKSAEVMQFLDKDLLPQVKEAFGLYRTADKVELEKELARTIQQARDLGFEDYEQAPRVKELRAKLASDAVDIGALENEVYDHLFSFFRRYYSEGDFLAKRVYKPGVYAIPYEGEEVKLHWANRDQYYIKTSEYLRDYAFRLRPEDDQKPMRVHFRLAEAAEGEHGNVKAVQGKDRVFVLTANDFIAEENGELSIRFEYRPVTLTDWPEDAREGKTKLPTEKDLIVITTKRVLALADASLTTWIAELGKPHVTASGERVDYTRLEAHLRRYTARNTFDYFIHKDLGGFLRRELDFYIKNEVMHLDDVENETAPRVEQYLSKIKVIRSIAGKIIDFLAQLEDFQKKLWLKKKFVVETNYCITLDRIPEEFYPEIAANDAQREEWVRLLAIDEIKGDLTTPGYSAPLTVEFLKAQPCLVIDTRFFSDDWTAQLVDRIESFENQQEGLLIQADNFDALNLLARRYVKEVSLVFIDPPYNTGVDGFPYKDSYQHASWLAMMQDRLELARALLSECGLLFCTIDFVEVSRLRLLMDMVFGGANFLADIAWEKRYMRSNNAKRFYSLKDTVLAYRASEAVDVIREARSEKSKSNYTNPDGDS